MSDGCRSSVGGLSGWCCRGRCEEVGAYDVSWVIMGNMLRGASMSTVE